LRRRRVVAVVLAGSATLVAACSSGKQATDDLMITDNPVAATPAVSPPATTPPAGTVLPLRAQVRAMAVDGRTRRLAVAIDASPAVLLYSLDNLSAAPMEIPLPSAPEDARLAADGGPLLVTVGTQLLRINLPDGAVAATSVDGAPASAAQLGGRTLVAVRDRHQVDVFDGGAVQRVISGNLFSADRVLTTGGHAVVLDWLRNAVFELDVPAGTVKQGLRAGEGSTNAVTDRFGRVLVADTRGGALLAFSLDPLLMRQRYPVGGAPFGIAYDPTRDMVWVTLTATNEVVGYQVAGEEPQERYRFPTLAQPNSVAVDGGRVFVASANGEGIQVISL
jgi:DNA-binding beta-propeller fold protein YncE